MNALALRLIPIAVKAPEDNPGLSACSMAGRVVRIGVAMQRDPGSLIR